MVLLCIPAKDMIRIIYDLTMNLQCLEFLERVQKTCAKLLIVYENLMLFMSLRNTNHFNDNGACICSGIVVES